MNKHRKIKTFKSHDNSRLFLPYTQLYPIQPLRNHNEFHFNANKHIINFISRKTNEINKQLELLTKTEL